MSARALRNPRTDRCRVRPGESLSQIALDQYGDAGVWPLISQHNRLRAPDLIFAGQEILLPRLPDLRPTTQSLSKFSSAVSGGQASAKLVALPAYKWDLTKMPLYEVQTPLYKLSLKLKGSLTIQKKGVLTAFTFANMKTIEHSIKMETAGAASALSNEVGINFDPKTGKLDLGFALVSTMKLPGGGTLTHKTTYDPPSKIKYTCDEKEVVGEYRDFLLKGKLGYELTIEFYDQRRPAHFKPVGNPYPNMSRIAEKLKPLFLTLAFFVALLIIVNFFIPLAVATAAFAVVSFVSALLMSQQSPPGGSIL